MSSAKGEMVALMRMTPSQFQAGWRRGRVMQWLGVARAWVSLGGAIYLLSLSDLHDYSPLSDDLGDVIGSVAQTASSGALLPLSILLCAVMCVPFEKYWRGSRTLRTVVLGGESKLISAAIGQPTPPTDDEPPRDVSSLRLLKPLVGTSNGLSVPLDATLLFSVSVTIRVFWREPDRSLLSTGKALLQLALVVLTIGRILAAMR
jgi:hypothetical protein